MDQLRPRVAAAGALLLAAFLLSPFSALPAHAQDAPPAAPPPGKALLYIFRSDRQPSDALVPVAVNAEAVGYMENGTFIAVAVDPGKTFLRSGDRVLGSLGFETAADRSYYVMVTAVHGTNLVQTDIALVTEADGRKALEQCRYVPLAPPPPPPSAPPGAGAHQAAPVPGSVT